MSNDDNPGVIAPPPLIFLGVLALALMVDFLVLPLRTGLPTGSRGAAAVLLVGCAGAFIVTALRGFRRAGTNPEPWRPSTAIVTTGVYRFTRNPMYVGMALAYVGLAMALDSGIALILFVPLIALIQAGVILREERYLEAKFGEPYRQYRGTVRRWL
jgi:protein-S-isoprenylcysteine O-methyltransferase Ste14